MKKNVVLVSSVAGIVLLTGAITFASNDGIKGLSGHREVGNMMNQNRSGQGFNGDEFEDLMMGDRGDHERKGGFKGGMGLGSGAGMWMNQNMQAVKTAIEKNDYAAYVAAYEKGKLTQEQFATLVKGAQAKSAIDTAIAKGDFVAYSTAVKGTPMEGKLTEAQFKDMVAKHTQRTAMRDAVTKNDYTAFIAAIKGTPMEGKVTQEQFATMVSHEKERGQISTTK